MKCIHSPSPTLLVGSSGFEPPTLRLSGARSNHLSYEPVSLYVGGDEGIRTLDPLLAGQVLSQLSYTPVPLLPPNGHSKLNNNPLKTPISVSVCLHAAVLLRKEVIQPHLPIRLPCYDLTLIIDPTFDGVLLAVRLPASGVANSHGLTGGVYKARERIHRSMLTYDY